MDIPDDNILKIYSQLLTNFDLSLLHKTPDMEILVLSSGLLFWNPLDVSIDATVSVWAGHTVSSQKYFAQTQSLQSYVLNVTLFIFGCNVQTFTEEAAA